MTIIQTIAKGGIATAAVGAMALAGATPAQARDGRDGLSVGDIVAGAVIIGGIAAVANAASRDRGYEYRGGSYYGRDGYRGNDRYGYRGNPRAAVERCVYAARVEARRYGHNYAQVTDIRDVEDTRYGWKVKGRIMVDNGYAGGRYDRNGYYGRDNRYNRWNERDSGSFTCYVERGQIAEVDIDGIKQNRYSNYRDYDRNYDRSYNRGRW